MIFISYDELPDNDTGSGLQGDVVDDDGQTHTRCLIKTLEDSGWVHSEMRVDGRVYQGLSKVTSK